MELPGAGGRGDLNQPEYLRCLAHEAARGAWNMAVDEALMASARSGRTTLRLYGWEPGCLSFGRNQTVRGRYDGEKARRRGIDVVRRPTGGRSVLHDREITYSVTAPADRWGGLRETYVLINRALAAGLRDLGVEATVAARDLRRPMPRPTVRACFRDPLPGEVTVQGRKLIGSAQWRERGALLQHGSLLIHNDQATVEELRKGDSVSPEVPAVGLADLLCPVPSRTDLIEALVDAFGRELSLTVHAGELTRAEKSAAGGFQTRYEDDAWTWRR
jgi:lipoate-protein ligase A